MRNRKLKTFLLLLTVTGIAAVAYCIGSGFISFSHRLPQGENAVQPSQVLKPTIEARLIGTHTVEYVEETVIKTEYVDVIRHVPVELRNFSTLEELKQWLNEKNQPASIRFQQNNTLSDCDDFAVELQQKALADGFIISFEIIKGIEYNELFITRLPTEQSLHAINLSIIDNDVYYIEPQTGEVVHAAYLD